MEERYRPYRSVRRSSRGSARPSARRSAPGPEQTPKLVRMPDPPRPPGVAAMRLHIFPPDTSARRRRIRFLFVTLLAVTAWGVVSIRKHDIGLADYRAATRALVEAMPYLIAAGPAVAETILKA